MSLAIQLHTETIGDKEIPSAFQRMGASGVTKLQNNANREAMGVLIREARVESPVDSGLLKKSLGIVARRYGGVAVSVLGPRKGFGRWVVSRGQDTRDAYGHKAFTSRSRRRLKGKYQDPSMYAHLVEGGHVIRHGRKGPVTGEVAGKHFLQSSFNASKGVMIAIWVAKVRQFIREFVA